MGCSRSRDTVIHSAGRYSEESRINNISVKSCEKHSNSDIRTNATDVEKKFYKQISTIHNGSNITTGITCGRNGLKFLSVFKCFTTFPSTLKL